MTLMTWQGKNINFWKNLSLHDQIFIKKKCDFRPIFFIFDLNASRANLMVGEQIFSQFNLKFIKYTSKINLWAIELTSNAKKMSVRFWLEVLIWVFPLKNWHFWALKSCPMRSRWKVFAKMDAIRSSEMPTNPRVGLWTHLTALDSPKPS